MQFAHGTDHWQLADYPARCSAMAPIGRAYPWSEFQRDIQRHAQSDSGWQSAWWIEQQATLQGHELAKFCERLPTWLSQTRVKQYPLGAHDPDPAMTLMRNLRAHSSTPPDASSVGNGLKAQATTVLVNPWPGHRSDLGSSATQPSVAG